jgi:hypothetical protein
MIRFRSALLAATLLAAGAGAALAQDAAVYDPSQLPATHGKVAQYSLTPRGDVDGLILADGTEVHLPPHLGTQLVFAVKPGDSVTIHGLRARAIPMVQAMSITNDASGATVADTGPGGPPGPGPRGRGAESLTAQGKVKADLHGPRGELNGALLEDGTIIRLPPPEAQRLSAELKPGATLYVRGDGVAGPLGKVIAVREIGPDAQQLTHIAAPPPPPHRPGHHPPPPPGGPDVPPPPPR